jgi:Flp pilus assembly pilin Flp
VQFIAYALSSLLVRIRGERGQDLLEYALLSGLIAAAIVAAGILLALQTDITSMVGQIGDCIDFDGGTQCDISGP